MTDQNTLKNWLTLSRTKNIGAVRAQILLQEFDTVEEIISFLHERDASKKLSFSYKLPRAQDIEKEIKATYNEDAFFLPIDDKDYPEALKNIPDAPLVLIGKGNRDLLNKACFAIVGSRNASMNAKRYTSQIAGQLGQNNFCVVSGLARGIDTAAHEGALKTGTIGVIAGGIDHIYPQENRALFEKLYKDGLVLTEMPIGYKVSARDFPRRNRIVAGLSYGTLVVEAALKSGSLITARLSGEYGREVYAIPGTPMDPRSAGTNKLIQDGAKLIQNADEIIDDLKPMISPPKLHKTIQKPVISNDEIHQEELKPVSDTENNLEEYIISLLNFQGSDIDLVIRECLEKMPSTSAETCLQTILNMELMGRVERMSGNKIALVS